MTRRDDHPLRGDDHDLQLAIDYGVSLRHWAVLHNDKVVAVRESYEGAVQFCVDLMHLRQSADVRILRVGGEQLIASSETK